MCDFVLHPRLVRDTSAVGRFPLSYLLLMEDANYPWCILVPARAGIQEIFQLEAEDQKQLIWESSLLGEAMMRLFQGDKLNIAALGNVVSQLHLHHVVRYRQDEAWPDPIWGRAVSACYQEEERLHRISQLQSALLDRTSTFSSDVGGI
ncbi:MAG: HIT domain-containing protein [Gammaproteobacteria bacterium]|nr:MAG: HIT domain-containing protein [Gammaproteobacteria bacterium]